MISGIAVAVASVEVNGFSNFMHNVVSVAVCMSQSFWFGGAPFVASLALLTLPSAHIPVFLGPNACPLGHAKARLIGFTCVSTGKPRRDAGTAVRGLVGRGLLRTRSSSLEGPAGCWCGGNAGLRSTQCCIATAAFRRGARCACAGCYWPWPWFITLGNALMPGRQPQCLRVLFSCDGSAWRNYPLPVLAGPLGIPRTIPRPPGSQSPFWSCATGTFKFGVDVR